MDRKLMLVGIVVLVAVLVGAILFLPSIGGAKDTNASGEFKIPFLVYPTERDRNWFYESPVYAAKQNRNYVEYVCPDGSRVSDLAGCNLNTDLEDGVQFSSKTLLRDGNFNIKVLGRVKNISNTYFKNVRVRVNLYGSGSVLLATDVVAVDPVKLLPGKMGTFERAFRPVDINKLDVNGVNVKGFDLELIG